MSLPLRCECGWDIPGDSFEARVVALRDHFDTVHADENVSDSAMRNYLQALDRLIPPRPPVQGAALDIRPVGPGNIDDFLDLFDHRAFSAFPGWAACYCMAHHVTSQDFEGRSVERNRAEMIERLRTGRTCGYLAYAGDEAVAWCNASPRGEFPDYCEGNSEDETTGLVGCFVVDPAYRNLGAASLLLDAAIDGFREAGMRAVEAWPRPSASTSEGLYTGRLDMLRRRGFEPVREQGPSLVVRRKL